MQSRMPGTALIILWLITGVGCRPTSRVDRVFPVVVTVEVVRGAPLTTPVLECTELETDMKVTSTILDKNDVRLDLEGFTSGEPVWFRFQLHHATGGRTYEPYPIATVGEDGRFSSTESLEDIIPNRPDTWDVRVVHSRGVVCTQVTMP